MLRDNARDKRDTGQIVKSYLNNGNQGKKEYFKGRGTKYVRCVEREGKVVKRAVVPHSTPAGSEADEVQTFPNQKLVSNAESPARVPGDVMAPPRPHRDVLCVPILVAISIFRWPLEAWPIHTLLLHTRTDIEYSGYSGWTHFCSSLLVDRLPYQALHLTGTYKEPHFGSFPEGHTVFSLFQSCKIVVKLSDPRELVWRCRQVVGKLRLLPKR